MNLVKKIWHDENSEPPKNYLWAKGGKLFKNIEGQWKEVSKKDSTDEQGSGSSDSGIGTIDYETIYQFYKKVVIEYIEAVGLPIEQAVIPDTLDDVLCIENNTYSPGTPGIWWLSRGELSTENPLFSINLFSDTQKILVVGQSTSEHLIG